MLIIAVWSLQINAESWRAKSGFSFWGKGVKKNAPRKSAERFIFFFGSDNLPPFAVCGGGEG